MPDTEVENILREIRERVYAEEEAAAAAREGSSNGVSPARENGASREAGSSPRLDSYLATTARAWDRLPPVVSNRSGTTARFEVWLKGYFKRATRWYAWEQVNFNAAVHHALTDMAQLLSANQETIQNLRAQLGAESESRQAEIERLKTQLEILIVEQRRTIEGESAAISAAVEAQAVVVDERLAAIVNELRETVTAFREEERVCFKQLALETSEAAVLEDRARRKTEARLEQLQRRIKELESDKS